MSAQGDDLEAAFGDPSPEELGDDVARARIRGALFGRSTEATRLGRYVLLHRVGAGANGVVWAAWDDQLDRRIAIKVLKPDRTPHLLAEAKALAKLSHPNIVGVHDVGVVHGQPFVAMEFVQGQDLAAWASARSDWREIVATYRQAGAGLAAAHAAGIVHRDFKPTNAMLGDDGRVRVLDFGLARVDRSQVEIDSDSGSPTLRSASGSEARTRTGVVGTPRYMPPEQHRGKPADARGDQFSFCASLWEALFSAPAFLGTNVDELYRAKLSGIRDPVVTGDVPSRVRAALKRGLATEPDERFGSMTALLAALRGEPRRWWPWAASGVLAAAAALAWQVQPADPCALAGGGLDATWSPQRAATISGAFADTRLPYATTSWSSAHRNVEAWADRWRAEQTEACRAHQRGEQSAQMLDLRSSCLTRQRSHFEALLSTFEDADTAVVDRAVAASRALPAVDGCANANALLRSGSPPASIADEVERWSERVARARVQLDAGRYATARELADGVLREHSRADGEFPPVAIRAYIVRGRAASLLGDHAEAIDDLRHAALASQREDVPGAFAEATADLVWEVGVEQGDLAQATAWGDLGRATLPRAGASAKVNASLLNAQGSALQTAGKYDAALESFAAFLEHVGRTWGPRDALAMAGHVNIGNVYNRLGRAAEAEASYARGIEIGTDALGAEHPRVLLARQNLIGLLGDTQRHDEAIAQAGTVLDAQTRALGADHPDLASTLVNLSLSHTQLRDGPKALAAAQRARRIVEAAHGPGSHFLTSVLLAEARALAVLERFEDAREAATRAADIARAAVGASHPDVAFAHRLVGELAVARGDYGEAKARLSQARKIFDDAGIDAQVALVDAALTEIPTHAADG